MSGTQTDGASSGPAQPFSLEAEQAVLGSLLLDAEAIVGVAPMLGPGDFYLEAHRLIYAAISGLYERSEPVDFVSVLSALEQEEHLARAGGRGYLLGLAPTVPTSYHVQHYAGIVARLAVLRRLITAGQRIVAIGYDDGNEAQDAVERAEAEVFAVAQRQGTHGFVHLREALAAYLDHLDVVSAQQGAVAGVPTGFLDLDRLLGGLQRSDLITIAARPSMGKSALALSICHNSSLRHKTRVALFSLEMSAEQLVQRLLCMEGRLDSARLRNGHLSDEEWGRIIAAAAVLSECPIYIDDSATLSTGEMRSKTRRLHQQEPLDLVIVDYLQLMNTKDRSENRVQEVSKISRDLKALARELGLPVIALSQLSRGVEARTSHIPLLSDLRESGSIEQDSDVVMFLYRDKVYNPETDNPRVADVIVAKHRNGPVDTVELYWDEQYTAFRDLAYATS